MSKGLVKEMANEQVLNYELTKKKHSCIAHRFTHLPSSQDIGEILVDLGLSAKRSSWYQNSPSFTQLKTTLIFKYVTDIIILLLMECSNHSYLPLVCPTRVGLNVRGYKASPSGCSSI